MENFITSTMKLGRKVSMVLWLIDQYSSLGCNEEVSICLNAKPADFQRKAGGYLVFTDLEEESYRVSVESPFFLDEEIQVNLSELDRSEPVVYIALKPSPTYQFNTGATLIRASLESQGKPLSTTITATLTSDDCARAHLGSKGAQAGDQELYLTDITGRIAPGDLLLIRSREEKTGEFCEVTTMGVGEGVYRLKQPLLSDHTPGELLMPAIITRSDQRGEAVIGIRNLRHKDCQVKVEAVKGTQISTVETTVKTGLITYMGKIVV